MIVTPRIAARMAVIGVLAVLLQVSFFSRVELFHTSPDVLPAVVASLGLLGGSMTGAVAGFSAGFLIDCLLLAPLGASSLVLLAAGYLAGLYRERFELNNRFTAPLLLMGFTFFSLVTMSAMQLMFGVDAPVSPLVIRDILIQTVYGFLVGWPIYIVIRRVLRAALVDDNRVTPRRRRRPRPAVSA